MLSRQQKLKRQQFWKILSSCLVTLVGFILFIFLSNNNSTIVKFPDVCGKSSLPFFFLGISAFLNASFLVNFLSSIFNWGEKNPLEFKRLKSIATHTLTIIFSLISAVWSNESFFDSSWTEKIIFLLSVIVIQVCLLTVVKEILNRYGICDSFSLFFFSGFLLNISNFELSWACFFDLIILILSALNAIYLFYLRWTLPVASNTIIDNEKSQYFKQQRFKFELKPNFSPIFIYWFRKLLSGLLSFILVFKTSTNLSNSKTLFEKTQKFARKFKKISENEKFLVPFIDNSTSTTEIKLMSVPRRDFLKEGLEFYYLPLILSEDRLFSYKTISLLTRKYNLVWIILSEVFLISLFALVVWIQTLSNKNFTPKGIAEEFQKRGIYFDKIKPGLETENLLKNTKIKMFVWWYIWQLLGSVVFDNLITVPWMGDILTFTTWISCVNTGIDIIDQTAEKINFLWISA